MGQPRQETAPSARFDVASLRERAGDKAFTRGESYFRDGEVEILSVEPARVLARVAGTEDYRAELKGGGKTFLGHCSCRAFADWGFCKHLVAVGLAANAAGDGEMAESDATSRIRAHLKSRGVDALVDMIVQIAENDVNLFQRLSLAATAFEGSDAVVERKLGKAIDGTIRVRGFVDYSEAGNWASGVDDVLETIEALVPAGRGALALKLVERAIDRIMQALPHVDDSDGEGSDLLGRAAGIHLSAAEQSRPEPVQFAKHLFAREMAEEVACLGGALDTYAAVLGEPGLAAYRAAAERAWRKLPALTPRSREQPANYSQLMEIMDFFAARDGDLDARIALRARDLSTPHSYRRLAEFCLASGRKDLALRYAEEGLWTFEDDDRQDDRLVRFVVDLLLQDGRKADAEAHLWRVFGKDPDLGLYELLCKVGGETVKQRAIRVLEELAAKPLPGVRIARAPNLLVKVLLTEGLFDRAWAIASRFPLARDLEEELARATEKTHPAQVLAMYQRWAEQLANSGDNLGYEKAAELIRRMATLRPAKEHVTYVLEFKVRHGRKRNLMKLLG
ncbi:acyltransferase [Bradyrhizobium ontarionense]|uniref:Acyltransferase n=1 Tax=Bradyrhizobium ontarionense TaxID=2898149 RepID=A0ABY3RE13_9BRAD|nr:DUF6880 family protein [Bradyrhizobium sp. A19]UFZ05190.1 acyltransferase [Bradyrhizobium sp. A19]